MITIYTQAYNVEPYIEQCIKSVISQTYHDFEWLLIENGSLDGTRDVIRKYAQLDDRIKVEYFDKNRTGFANDYIQEKAKGEYIVKLDSDDWIEPDYLEKLLNPMEKQKVDISICGAVDYEEETGEKFPHEYGLLNGIYQTTDIRENYIELRSYLGTYWGKMFKKDIFCKILPKMKVVDKKLEQGSYFGGDTAFMLYYVMECKKMAFINERMYYYRIHGGGAASRTMGINRISSYFILREIEKEFLIKCNAVTNKNITLIEISVWTNVEKLLKSIINADLPLEKKLRIIHEIYIDPRIKQFRKESYNSKVHAILSTYAAWYFMNMGEKQNKDLRDVFILLEPDIFVNITDDTYEWMSRQKELMAYIIVGEYAGAREYVKKIMDDSNITYIFDLLKWLEP